MEFPNNYSSSNPIKRIRSIPYFAFFALIVLNIAVFLVRSNNPLQSGSFIGKSTGANTPGSPDTSFGGNGIQKDGFGNGSDEIHAVALQADNKIAVAGRASQGAGFPAAVARSNADGSLDASFNETGIQSRAALGVAIPSRTRRAV